MKSLVKLASALTLILFALIMINNISAADQGKKAPDFALKDLSGKSISLSDYKGKVVFLNFWATWCPPCRQEIPGFIKAFDKYKDQGLVILGVAVSDRENSVKNFVDRNKINYPVAMGDMKIVQDYEPGQYIPATVIIDRNGKIHHKHVGYMELSQVEDLFQELSK
jgi:cytochrome c biogenesis protein CcmG/thiol:disulfide interchange protein DsbE